MDLHPPGESDPTSPTDARRLGRADLKLSPRVRRLRRFWRTIPSAPRCKMCTSPFGPPAGPLLRLIGKGRWAGNSDYCAGCFKQLYRHRDGAEIECTLLFADIRGSTQLAESMSATDFRALLDRYYRTAAEVLIGTRRSSTSSSATRSSRSSSRRWPARTMRARRSTPAWICFARPAMRPMRHGRRSASASTPARHSSASWARPTTWSSPRSATT